MLKYRISNCSHPQPGPLNRANYCQNSQHSEDPALPKRSPALRKQRIVGALPSWDRMGELRACWHWENYGVESGVQEEVGRAWGEKSPAMLARKTIGDNLWAALRCGSPTCSSSLKEKLSLSLLPCSRLCCQGQNPISTSFCSFFVCHDLLHQIP